MARIRTIKPEFWTDEKLTECSLSARLLFIGILNFADDNGNIEASAKQMKMKIFPADCIKTEPLICELLTHGLLIEYSVNSVKYMNVKGFKKHQIINRPSKSKTPEYEESLQTHTLLTEYSLTEGKGREGKGREEEPKVKRLADFETFWNVFNLKQGKGGAEKAWLSIQNYSPALLQKIIEGAKLEAERRPSLIAHNKTPKWAQGWITERRWEDDIQTVIAKTASSSAMGAMARAAALRKEQGGLYEIPAQ